MEIVHVAKCPNYKKPNEVERGKVYRLFKPQGENYVSTDSYYLVGSNEHNTGTHELDGWWLINLRSGIMLPMMQAHENDYRFELTEAYVHMGTVTP
ncbi:hypothetical protein PQD73_gp082 [Stenotrophomonas phage Salva]|uniref:Uncharacterized protein n=1 Tax=Stenotrophomonas phage Salva TaxID=2801524 RepID=A0A8B6Q8A2_9CAUD|nr:hypothetical protein PQD73_gp082 [Stenotrophomonas phage Salva]QQM18257.1 hypothetical protein CPT_Salva_094 [Stenotrophomonas phage Salva]